MLCGVCGVCYVECYVEDTVYLFSVEYRMCECEVCRMCEV